MQSVGACVTSIGVIAALIVDRLARRSWPAALGQRFSPLCGLSEPLLHSVYDLHEVNAFAVDAADPEARRIAARQGQKSDADLHIGYRLAALVAAQGGQEVQNKQGQHWQVLILQLVHDEGAGDGLDPGRPRLRRREGVSLKALGHDGVAQLYHVV